ncbi:MAG: geranylgeranylglyceryl/heptaprenylglyceryl phosphate synthase [Bacteroidetes bacterium]|nr:MAG: geranylgeranylglyceryl/heptaprenylglyceryl phosphate synthase [Bacteroidota bacterium]
MIAVLVDPDKASDNQLDNLIFHPSFDQVDFLFVGGSLITDGNMKICLEGLKKRTNKPLIIFPGSPNQIDDTADAILLLSLISGRNSDMLIGRHVESAHKLKHSNLEILSTGYILVDGGRTTTVSYISGTIPIPQDKPGIAAATALAGSQLGQQLIYLDCGSGADMYASPKLVGAVKNEVNIPVIVGGGIKTQEDAETVFRSGADVVVVGNKLEENPEFLTQLVKAKESYNTKDA